MRRYLYILAILFVSCVKENITLPYSSEEAVTIALDLKLQGAEVHSVDTRATGGSNWAEKENVTKITGYAFVFGNDPNLDGTYGDDSPLLQKVAFKSIDQGASTTIYVTLDKQTESCFIRLMTSMTGPVRDQIEGFISQKQVDERGSGAVTTFADYKHISVSLDGYYNISDSDNDTPDPNNLTTNLAFPLASPGINMPQGLNEQTVAAMNKIAYMVPAASKVDVTSNCNFDLQQVTLLNGARMARLRSTVITDDGLDVIYKLPLPINLGGVTQFEAVDATGGTTAATPIYFFPNEGDGPFDNPVDSENENNTELSDEINTRNPTYLIVKGRAAGYDVDGYYKIAIVYEVEVLGTDGKPTGEYSDPTYDIVRNNHYRVSLNKVDNPGYATFSEAVAGPANNIAYDITIGGGEMGDSYDPRTETIASHNGFFYLQLVGSEIFAQGYSTEGVEGSFDLKLVRNNQIDSQYDIPTLYISSTDGITINNNSTIADDNFDGTINFTATKSGTITLRCGDMLRQIPVHYEPMPHIWQSGATIGGVELSAVGEAVADDSAAGDMDMIDASGSIAENTTYKNREFRGKIYPSDMSKGIRKVYCKQASNFELNTYYDNSYDAATGGNSGTNNIFSTTSSDAMSAVYSAAINYQSTGKVYQIDGVDRGVLDSESIMREWWIGAAPIEFSAKGEFYSSIEGSLSNFNVVGSFSELSEGETVTIQAPSIGHNQIGGSYDPDRSQVSDSTTLTLTNIAGQTKSYTMNLDQYAAPYIDDDEVSYDPDTGIYTWNCPLIADIYWIGDNNVGEYRDSPTVYNARYRSGDDGDWSWSEAPTEGDWRGGSEGLDYVEAAFNVASVPDTQGIPTTSTHYYFRIKVEGSSGVIRNNWQAYFDLKMSNGANEQIFFRFRLRRDD